MGSTFALDLFARTLTRPEPGFYCYSEYCGGVQPWGVDEDVYVADWAPLPDVYVYDFRVPLGDGRYLHNDFDYEQGYFWGDYQTQVGSYYDKVWAVWYLAEAFDGFISNSREDFVDSRYKNVNFATVYPRQVERLFANLLTGDYAAYAPWVVAPVAQDQTPDAQVAYPRWFAVDDVDERPGESFLVDPNVGWNTQIYAMVWGTMFFPTNWSTSWVHDARIATMDGEGPAWTEEETYRFVDPASGVAYRAHKGGTATVLGRDRQRTVGARALEWANHLLAVAYEVERDDDGAPVLAADGTPTVLRDADGRPLLDASHPGADAELRRYVDTLDLFRQLTATFEHPLEGGLPEPP